LQVDTGYLRKYLHGIYPVKTFAGMLQVGYLPRARGLSLDFLVGN